MMRRTLEEALDRLALRDRHLLVAVSGGVDSTALLHGLHVLSSRRGLKLSIGHVNHGLRGAESEADEQAVRGLAAALGLPIQTERVAPETLREGSSSRLRPTLQEAARALRYRALRAIAARADASCIATAHTADDQAETVLMRVLRGCGPDALGGIPERSADGHLVRPLLGTSRHEILAYARAEGLAWREDGSNANPRFTRSRLRHAWLPGLAEEFNPQLLRAIGKLAEAQRRDSAWLESLVDAEVDRRLAIERDAVEIDCVDFERLPDALAWRLARRALLALGLGRELTEVHLRRVLTMLRTGRPGATIELPAGSRLTRGASRCRIWRLRVEPPGPC